MGTGSTSADAAARGAALQAGAAWVAVSGSTIGHGVTVNVDARPYRAAAAVRAVRPDPQADAEFVGRDRELAELLGVLRPHPVSESEKTATAADSGGVVVSAVAGAPGVGKTALAQAAARAAVTRGWFPGGAVGVDLHGYDPDPAAVVWPAQLYASLLRALGVPGEQVPPGESDQATVYHRLLDQLAAAGRAVLLVFDNVGDPDQVSELLPQARGHRVLITSRDSLAALPQARLLELHVLDPDAAVRLLTVGLRRRHPTDGRVSADPQVAARLVELCGWLPLAVQIVAALLADEPDRPVIELVGELADEGHRLRGLAYDRRWAVRAAFDLSYRRLDPAIGRLFTVLAGAPGPDVGLGVAAVLAEQPEPQARGGLRELCRAHLLEQLPATQPGQGPRWRMHDLIRLYAAEHLADDQRAAAFTWVLGYYRRTTELAERRFTALPAQAAAVPAGFDTPAQAMAWVMAERAGLLATVTQAAGSHPEAAVRLVLDLAPFLSRARLVGDWVTVADAAVRAAGQTGDRELAARAWAGLGLALRQVGRFQEAITAHQLARDIYREIGNRVREGQSWNHLGNALRQTGRFEEAITAHQLARDISRESGDRRREGEAWNHLGLALRRVQRFEEAITAHQQARDIAREIGDRRREGSAWNNLGLVLQEMRRFDEAITAYQHDIAICDELDDHYGEAQTLTNLAEVHAELDDPQQARRAWTAAAQLFAAVGAEDDTDRVRQQIADLDR